MMLPAHPPNLAYSETFFSTHAIGSVVLTSGGTRIGSAANEQQRCSGPAPLIQVTVTPPAVRLTPSSAQQFSARISGHADTGVSWSVQEGAGGGDVDASGRYIAAATPGVYHVIAVSHADPTRTATATVTVTAAPFQVAVTPSAVTVTANGTQKFSAQVSGGTGSALLWSVQEGSAGGAVDSTGLYTAPAAAGTFHVIAMNQADHTQSATATVTVIPAPVQVAVTPSAVSVTSNGTQQFSAQVSGSTDTALLWSVQEGDTGGAIDSAGLYTAPAASGTFHVIAVSHADPTRSATATVTVTAPLRVTMRPTSVTMGPNAVQQFSAQVSNAADTALLWSVQEGAAGGAVDSDGLYTAPAASGTFHVIATSHADPTRSATATVIVRAAAQLGLWDAPQRWPLIPIHVALLHDGRVLAWSRLGVPSVWNPSSNTFLQVPSPSWEFCAGTTMLPDGKMLVAGGHVSDNVGLSDVNVYDPDASAWSKAPSMAAGRWYPTTITLSDGTVAVVAGAEADSSQNLIPEVRNPDGTWRRLTGASLETPYYPSLFPAPDGSVFMAGSDRHSKYLDTSGTGGWIAGPTSKFGNRSYGTAVMYQPGKVMIAGGASSPPTNTAELIDLNASSPSWRYTASMNHARRMLNATVLPDGKVLVTGGTSGSGFNDETHAELSAELWDPATEQWTELSSEKIVRVYHSVALLMPDARVMVGGGGEGGNGTDERNIEMFTPPYLFASDGSLAARPTITAAPDSVGYGESFQISSPDAANISRVTFIRTGVVTHSFNVSQLLVPLQFTATGAGSLRLTAPADRNLAPPGYYMIFILDANGVPSRARMVRLG